MYNVKLEKFEGPLELLLELIEKEELSITEFSLAHVADQYLEYIKNNENIHLENLADFLVVASRLILIKSRAILPSLKITDEEEEEIKDLEEQLKQYKKFKEVSKKIGEVAERGNISYSREGFLGIQSFFYPPENFNSYDLKKNFLLVLDQIPIVERLQEEIVSEVVTLEERIDELQNTLRSRIETSFSQLISDAADKVEVIVSFLAMLEMVKQRLVNVEQEELFSEIKLSISARN